MYQHIVANHAYSAKSQAAMTTPTTHSISSTNAGDIELHVYEPENVSSSSIRGTIVAVHPWSVLGGGEHNTVGLAKFIVAGGSKSEQKGGGWTGSKKRGGAWRVITFKLKSTILCHGGVFGGIFSNHSHEVHQILDVVNLWVRKQYGQDSNIVLLGCSAGAPMAGTAMAKLSNISGYIAVGYTFGYLSSIAFGRHYSFLISSSTPKLFIMGEKDEFTSVHQLEEMAARMRRANGSNVDVDILSVLFAYPQIDHV